MDERLEVRIAHWPLGERESILIVVDGDYAVQRLVSGFADLTKDEEDWLVHLRAISDTIWRTV